MQVLLLYTILPSFVLISAILATLRRGALCAPPLVLKGSKKPGINRVKCHNAGAVSRIKSLLLFDSSKLIFDYYIIDICIIHFNLSNFSCLDYNKV